MGCHECWIDNTNLAVWKGTGKNAVMAPEMTAFARSYGFEWHAHELGHANRKAGKERNFWTLETNFFPGRRFRDLEDLNKQAKEWATERYFRRPHAKTKIIPAEAFEAEKPSLVRIPETVIAPYREHERPTDRKGYVALRANFYWVPGTLAHEPMTLIETPSRLKIYRRHECVADYPLAAADKRGEKQRPEGMPLVPERPQNDRVGSHDEEKRLRGVGPHAEEYLDWLKNTPGRVRYRHRFIRELYAQSKTMTPSLFEKAIDQARRHGIAEIDAIERIARAMLNTQDSDSTWKDEPAPVEYLNRESYHEGRFSDEPTLTLYADLFERKKQEGKE